MRNVPGEMWYTWEQGKFLGEDRPITRATISRSMLESFEGGHFRSLLFGSRVAEYEIQNIRTCSIDKRLGTDAAQMTLTLLNASRVDVEENLDETYIEAGGGAAGGPTKRELMEFGSPGGFSYRRGVANTGDGSPNPWAHAPDPIWADMFVPNRVIKTFQGYGTDSSGYPWNDTKLVQTGVWLIDKVSMSADGIITLTCRDSAKLLIEQRLYPPIVPPESYQLDLCGPYKKVGYEKSVSVEKTPEAIGPDVAHQSTRTYDSSTAYYSISVYGHVTAHAFDGDPTTWWVSMRNGKPSRDWSYEWIDADCKDEPISRVRFKPWAGGYTCYVGVKVDGTWQGTSTVPYNPDAGPSFPNTSNIKYVKKINVPSGEDWVTVDLDEIYAAEYVRLVFTDLQDFSAISGRDDGDYRAGVYEFQVMAYTAPATETTETIEEVVTNPDGNISDYCADEETEILTRRGWLCWDEVEEGDETLAINPETGLAAWDRINGVYRKHRKREMVSMEGASHSSLTTPDHRWLVQGQNGRWSWKTTETLATGNRIPFSASRSDYPELAKYDDALVELVAWFYTEGSYNTTGAEIGQSHRVNGPYVERIRSVLTILFGQSGRVPPIKKADPYPPYWSEGCSDKRGMTFFRLSKTARQVLDEVVPDKVPTMEFLAALTRSQLGLFVGTSIDADGHRVNGREFFQQKDERRAKVFEAACALLGVGTSTSTANGMFQTSVLKNDRFLPVNADRSSTRFVIERQQYEGVVWCPTLESGNWLARRNGKVYYTGNTDIIKLFLAWSGFYWPKGRIAVGGLSDSGFSDSDPLFLRDDWGAEGGRVWGDFFDSGAYPLEPPCIPPEYWDNKSVQDGINQIKEILGFIGYVDATGGFVWRPPNIWKTGNFISGKGYQGETSIPIITEENVLLDFGVTVDDASLRSEIVVVQKDPDPEGSMIWGSFTPDWAGEGYPETVDGSIGLVSDKSLLAGQIRTMLVADYPFGQDLNDEEKARAEVNKFAYLVSLWIHWSYRKTKFRIPGMPALEPDDQVRIFERITSETYIHYLLGVNSVMDMDAGTWYMDIDTHWLGNGPDSEWHVNAAKMSPALFAYLVEAGLILDPDDADPDYEYPEDWYKYVPPTPPKDLPRVADDYEYLFPDLPAVVWPAWDWDPEVGDDGWVEPPSSTSAGTTRNCSPSHQFEFWPGAGPVTRSLYPIKCHSGYISKRWFYGVYPSGSHANVDSRAWPAFKMLCDIMKDEGYQVVSASGYYCRHIKNIKTPQWSNHAWGLAVDINYSWYGRNKATDSLVRVGARALAIRAKGPDGKYNIPVFSWGQYFRNADPAHFQVCCAPEDIARGLTQTPPWWT